MANRFKYEMSPRDISLSILVDVSKTSPAHWVPNNWGRAKNLAGLTIDTDRQLYYYLPSTNRYWSHNLRSMSGTQKHLPSLVTNLHGRCHKQPIIDLAFNSVSWRHPSHPRRWRLIDWLWSSGITLVIVGYHLGWACLTPINTWPNFLILPNHGQKTWALTQISSIQQIQNQRYIFTHCSCLHSMKLS